MDSNRKTHTLILSLLLITTFFKGLFMSVIVPTFEFPDEQAHFAMVSYLAEVGHQFDTNDLSKEIYLTELALGTARNDRGINQYTYKRDFMPVYTDSKIGFYEPQILNSPIKARTEFVKTEAARYPRLFYDLSGIGYRLSYHQDIFTRLFITRVVSVFITVASVYLSFLLGKLLFSSFLGGITLAGIISFHPMFSFVSSGVNNDNLTNFWGLCLVYLSVVLIKDGLNFRTSLLIGVVSGLGILTKPLILPLVIALGFVILYEWFLSKRAFKTQIKLLIPLICGGLIFGGYKIILPWIETGRIPYITKAKPDSGLSGLTLATYAKNQIGQYYRETLVWYWGVFKWLGVILPLNLIRLIKVVMIISGLGILRVLFFKSAVIQKKQLINLAMLSVIFVLALSLWDYDMLRKNGFSHGLQGRYFFPTIGAHLSLLLAGIIALFPDKFKDWGYKLSLGAMVIVQCVSLLVLIKAYYPLNSLSELLIIMSQNKSFLLKTPYSLLLTTFYFLSLGIFLINFLSYQNQKKHNE